MRKAVVLLSGGLDSATCAAVAKDEGFELYALSFCYGQRHAVEIASARRVAQWLGAKAHHIAEVDLSAFGGALLDETSQVPKDRPPGPHTRTIPPTYVPARNTIFLSYALGWAEVLDASDIFIGVNAVDYSGYPDCRPEYIEAFQKMAALATKRAVEGNNIMIHTPLIGLSKADIIRLGMGLEIDYGITHSCYDPSVDGLACGRCDSCILRRRGFEEAGVVDPTRYQT